MKTPTDAPADALKVVFAGPPVEVTARCRCGRVFSRVVATEAEARLIRERGQCDGCYAQQEAARDMEE